MAARINKKVVIPLIATLVLGAAGTIGLAWYTLHRTADFYKGKGDAAAAAGDWRTAEDFYSKAVYQDQGNVQLIDTWRESISQIVPVDGLEAKQYFQQVSDLVRRKTEIRSFEPQFHVDWLTYIMTVMLPEPSPSDATFLASNAQTMLDARPASDTNPLWEHGYRFRGIGTTYRMRDAGLGQDQRDQALSDLQRWLSGSPDDSLATATLVKWHLFTAESMKSTARPAEVLAEIDKGVQVADDFLNDHPDDVLMYSTLSAALQTRLAVEQTIPGSKTGTAARLHEVQAQAESLAFEQDGLPWWLVRRVANEVIRLEPQPEEGYRRAARVVEHAITQSPDDPLLLFERASLLQRAGDYDAAVKAFEAIINAPNLPIGGKSLALIARRPRAVTALFDMDLERWKSTDPAQSQAFADARAKVKSRVDQYRALVTSSDPQLMYLEGRFALADGQSDVAASRLNQFLTTVGRENIDPPQRVLTLIDLAEALHQTGRSGAAYDYLAEVDLLMAGTNPKVLYSLITLDLDSQNFDRAQKNLRRLQVLAPDSDIARELSNRLAVAQNGVNASVQQDAALSAILQARELAQDGQIDQARQVLLDAQQNEPKNLGITYERARLEASQGNTDKALEFVRQALAVNPKSEQWRILEAVISKQDLRPLLSQIVDDRPGLTEYDRHVAKWRLFAENGFSDEAKQEFQAAKSINPDAPDVIEQEFSMAMAADDTAAIEAAVRHAQSTNADLVNGLTFRGRYEVQRGDTAAAIATLLQATSLKPYDGATWRFLGVAYREAGNYDAAMDAFSKSLEREPASVVTLKELASLQIRRGQNAEALKTIRKAQRYAPSDPSIRDSYLDLEGRYGDRASVLRTREQRLASNPKDLDNALALVNLYEYDNRFDAALKVLDALKPQDQAEQLRLVVARSLWHARQGQVEQGRQVLVDFTESTPPPPNDLMTKALVSLTQYYIDMGDPEKAIETAKSAAPYQDPTLREADRSLAEIYMSLHRIDEALETYERAFIDAESSPVLSLQLVNLHLAIARRDSDTDPQSATTHRRRAASLLSNHEKAQGASVQTALLRGELAFQNGDMTTAERVFNEAVANYPQDAHVYEARARFDLSRMIKSNDSSRASRIRSDVDQALQLNPTSAAPLDILVQLAGARRDPRTNAPNPDVDAMIAAWRRILAIDPRNEDARGRLVETLYARGEYTQAQVLIAEAIQLDPNRGAWYEVRGDMERQTGRPASSYADWYAQAFEKQPSANRLAKLARAWLALDPPRAAPVVELYQKFAQEVAGMPTHRLLLATAQSALKDEPAALKSLHEAADMILAETDAAERDAAMQEWYEALGAIVPPQQFAAVSDECFASFDDPWPQALLGNALYLVSAGSPDQKALADDGIARMAVAQNRVKDLLPSERATRLQREIGWNLASAYYATNQPAKAVETWRWVLKAAPDHFATLNNLAFVLANDLNDPKAALEPAKQAYAASPADPTMLDTYGYVLFRNNLLDDAERMLRDSLDRQEQSGTRMHLGQVLAARGNVEDARRELNRARSLAQQQGNAERVRQVDDILKQL